MKHLLAAIYWKFFAPKEKIGYEYELPKDGFKGKVPLKLSSTVLPKGYPNCLINLEDRQYFSKIIRTI